mmetsp:Transcript_11633/g.43098  ORF Transcript_11633/g.43098 Transcript_11633/m.43098 type:complete len:229 (+) Transcript_11633:529-1215(+)
MRRSHHRKTVCAVPADRMRCKSKTPSSSSHRKCPSSCACSSHAVALSHCPVSSATSTRASNVIASGAMPSSCIRAIASPARCHCRRASCDAMSELYVCTVRFTFAFCISENTRSTSSPRPAMCSARNSASYAKVSAAPGNAGGGMLWNDPRRAVAEEAPIETPRSLPSPASDSAGPGGFRTNRVSSATTTRKRSHKSPRSLRGRNESGTTPSNEAEVLAVVTSGLTVS